jgi:hypothetical protein
VVGYDGDAGVAGCDRLLMPRLPASWRRVGIGQYAGSLPQRGISAQRIPVPGMGAYRNQVTVDMGNDGIAPQVTFTAGGAATAFCGPSSWADTWSLDQCYLSTSVGPLDPSLVTVFAGPLPVAQYAVTSSLGGGGSQFGMGGVTIPFGWFVWGVWSGGTAGALANLRVTGSKTVLTN